MENRSRKWIKKLEHIWLPTTFDGTIVNERKEEKEETKSHTKTKRKKIEN